MKPSNIIVSNIVDEDITNYKKCAMFIGTVKCSFKCCTELGLPISTCQNNKLISCHHDIKIEKIVDRYIANNLTEAIVIAGMEPLDQFDEVLSLIEAFRFKTEDDIIIYTGYNENEIKDKIDIISQFKNIIVKFGRFIPNQKSRYDDVLGVSLISDNQYAKRIS